MYFFLGNDNEWRLDDEELTVLSNNLSNDALLVIMEDEINNIKVEGTITLGNKIVNLAKDVHEMLISNEEGQLEVINCFKSLVRFLMNIFYSTNFKKKI